MKMKRFDLRVFLGFGLIFLGGLFLLQSFGVINRALPVIWAFIFAAGGLLFLYFFSINREQWWALIPGCVGLGLGGVIAWSEFGPAGWGEIGGAFFLLTIAISFFAIYLANREHWWALIPGGVLASVAMLIVLTRFIDEGEVVTAIFFFGIAFSFIVVANIPTKQGPMRWAYIPAIIMAVVGGLLLAAATDALQFLWPIALVIGGLLLLFRGFFKGGGSAAEMRDGATLERPDGLQE
jgi:hypothetical protein